MRVGEKSLEKGVRHDPGLRPRCLARMLDFSAAGRSVKRASGSRQRGEVVRSAGRFFTISSAESRP